MSDFDRITTFLKTYDGPPVKLMEICGTHTASIARNGLRSMLSPKIELVSGPGCPVCVSALPYIDALCDLSQRDGYCVASFGDMLRVPGSEKSLSDAMSEGGRVKMLYSPFELLKIAPENPDTMYVFAAVGFETTTPLYALLLEKVIQAGIKNIKILTSLKVMPPAIEWLCGQKTDITGFIAPGHVSVITGTGIYLPIAQKAGVPFAVTGFEAKDILESIYVLVHKQGCGEVYNLYPTAVRTEGNETAQNKVAAMFEPGDASWRGLARIKDSGTYLKNEFAYFDAGSRNLFEEKREKNACRCSDILTGRITPVQCPLFGKACNPRNPMGACMVSQEGTCRIWMEN